MNTTIGFIVALLTSVGAALTLVGMLLGFLRPDLKSSKTLEEWWAETAAQPILRVPAQAVQGFIDFAQTASESTANRFTQASAVFAIGLLSILAVFYMFAPTEGSGAAFNRLIPFAVATGLGLIAVLFIKLGGRSLDKLISRVRLDGDFNRNKQRIADLEERKGYLESMVEGADENDPLADYWRRELGRVEARLAGANRHSSWVDSRRSDLGEVEQLVAEARSGTFFVFLVTTAMVGWLGLLFWNNFSTPLMGVFDQPIGEALRIILLATPTLLLIFIFLQTLVPAFQILSSRDPTGTSQSRDPLNQSNVFLFLLGISLSLSLTFAALALGHALVPEAPLPQTLQLVVFNGVFDGLTLMLTILVLRWATRENRWGSRRIMANLALFFKVLAAILIDLAIAAVLAVFSLYFALFGSELQISFLEALRILVGLAPDGSGPEFGPYFWVMHTAFIPTAAYLIVLIVLILMKMIAFVFFRLLGGRLGNVIPATGALLMALASLLSGLAYLAGMHRSPLI